jgi:hypothetical protein
MVIILSDFFVRSVVNDGTGANPTSDLYKFIRSGMYTCIGNRSVMTSHGMLSLIIMISLCINHCTWLVFHISLRTGDILGEEFDGLLQSWV